MIGFGQFHSIKVDSNGHSEKNKFSADISWA